MENDYISRAEFVRELGDIIARCNQTGVTDDFQYHELVGEENAIKAIRCLVKAFPAADVRPAKWIPVTERLPDNRNYVLACFDDIQAIAFYDDSMWREVITHAVFYPTHWMPLPEPPEEDRDDA